MPTFELIAGTFKEGETIPKPHTCEGRTVRHHCAGIILLRAPAALR